MDYFDVKITSLEKLLKDVAGKYATGDEVLLPKTSRLKMEGCCRSLSRATPLVRDKLDQSS
ncbi:hypothetical protein KSP40_PGU021908 [Platanthera guangdongensis]|uniref:Uncharacterized protein n=1 Tax=Platanthera guangdongensis TaxID=2320717 RepID=A0ABR2MV23_9ASPA